MEQSGNATLYDAISAAIPESEVYWKTIGGIQIVIAAVAVVGNTLVGCTLLTNRQLRKNPNNILMANLAMADGVFAVVLFFMGYWNTTAGLYPFGELACRLHMVFAVSSSQVSNNILAAMSVVKFIHVSFPFTSDTILQLARRYRGVLCDVLVSAIRLEHCHLHIFCWSVAISRISLLPCIHGYRQYIGFTGFLFRPAFHRRHSNGSRVSHRSSPPQEYRRLDRRHRWSPKHRSHHRRATDVVEGRTYIRRHRDGVSPHAGADVFQ